MQARFLLGPAGSGKTFRCVAEVRAELLRSPDGPPLIFLAPKQATFQIERQLLADPQLTGYSRLHILSFERLAVFCFAQLGLPVPEMLSEPGRVMALRALLAREQSQLKVFRASARLTGFAAQLSQLLRELQCHRVTPTRLNELSGRVQHSQRLDDKLHDLARLLGGYEAWLAGRRAAGQSLEDADRLPDLATTVLQQATAAGKSLQLGALWLDGFAEMTPQEIALLAALAPHCERMTLAFCLNDETDVAPAWLSPWAIVGRTYGRCREALRAWPVQVEMLDRAPAHSRFANAPELARLELALAGGMGRSRADVEANDVSAASGAVRLIECAQPEAEAQFAAREILAHVHAGGRFRECAVLVRSLADHHDGLRRGFERYDIPFFLDRRESVAHHPLAELTRFALRTVAFDWRHEDWFGALKSGLTPAKDDEVDALENEALHFGWQGRVWREVLPAKAEKGKRQSGIAKATSGQPALGPAQAENPDSEPHVLVHPLEKVRARTVPTFLELSRSLLTEASVVSGRTLAAAIRQLWDELKIERRLADWTAAAAAIGVQRTAHDAVRTQMNDWLANVELAFADEVLPLRDWLPILEAGLVGLTVGAVPPALDQVLVGSIDRSRNPDLQRVFILGVNEGIFPAPPQPGPLLSEADRLELEAHGMGLGANQRLQLGHERYFGYIACTRARAGLAVSWSLADTEGRALNPSPLVSAIQRALPSVPVEHFTAPLWSAALHAHELEVPLLTAPTGPLGSLTETEEFESLVERGRQARLIIAAERLSPEVAHALYGTELKTSVSALEQFLGCPFQYVAARALRTEEREEFAADIRQKGSFQHAVMELFHRRIQDSGRQWRDLTPAEARQCVQDIGRELIPVFRDGLFDADDAARFTANALLDNLARLVETLIGWTAQYTFDPTRVEVGFGLPDAELPAWRIGLRDDHWLVLRGRIDRVDLCRTPQGEALLVICDYKSSGKKMDPLKLTHGLEIQLLAYLAVLAQMPEARVLFGVDKLTPTGVFYIPLRGKVGAVETRAEGVAATADFQHLGRFDGAWLSAFDARGEKKGDQFKYSLKKDGGWASRGNDALPAGEFPQLLTQIEVTLKQAGERIFSGEAAVSPYRLKQETACDRCAYRAVCRFDPWTMTFRALKEEGA